MSEKNPYLLRVPTPAEVDQLGLMVHEAIGAHRDQLKRYFQDPVTLKGHHKPGWPDCWEHASEVHRRECCWPVTQILSCKGQWHGATIRPAYMECGCGAIALATTRIAMVEMGILPLKTPVPVHLMGELMQEAELINALPGRRNPKQPAD